MPAWILEGLQEVDWLTMHKRLVFGLSRIRAIVGKDVWNERDTDVQSFSAQVEKWVQLPRFCKWFIEWWETHFTLLHHLRALASLVSFTTLATLDDSESFAQEGNREIMPKRTKTFEGLIQAVPTIAIVVVTDVNPSTSLFVPSYDADHISTAQRNCPRGGSEHELPKKLIAAVKGRDPAITIGPGWGR